MAACVTSQFVADDVVRRGGGYDCDNVGPHVPNVSLSRSTSPGSSTCAQGEGIDVGQSSCSSTPLSRNAVRVSSPASCRMPLDSFEDEVTRERSDSCDGPYSPNTLKSASSASIPFHELAAPPGLEDSGGTEAANREPLYVGRERSSRAWWLAHDLVPHSLSRCKFDKEEIHRFNSALYFCAENENMPSEELSTPPGLETVWSGVRPVSAKAVWSSPMCSESLSEYMRTPLYVDDSRLAVRDFNGELLPARLSKSWMHAAPPSTHAFPSRFQQKAMQTMCAGLPSEANFANGLSEAELGSDALPTIGSKGHNSGNCKPCAFAHSKGCNNGIQCSFCHLCPPDERKLRKKERKMYRLLKTRGC
eukprot:TRINITY_DN3366_c0_g7_i1.p1 TRINITY_DN3366_c0_g7~~TRINITY_DN3366_c0_g7_i1.p1  ORF type:complete len:362 (+),score=19.61 TRINITY_DN3366_c0_g7_i1:53-1138(+)